MNAPLAKGFGFGAQLVSAAPAWNPAHVVGAIVAATKKVLYGNEFDGAARDFKLAMDIADVVLADLMRPAPDNGKGVVQAIRSALIGNDYLILAASKRVVDQLADEAVKRAREAGFRD